MKTLYMHFIFDDVNNNFELQEDCSWTARCHIYMYMTFKSRVIDWYLCKSFAVWQYVLCCTNFSFLNSLVTFLRQMSDRVVDNVWWLFNCFVTHTRNCVIIHVYWLNVIFKGGKLNCVIHQVIHQVEI